MKSQLKFRVSICIKSDVRSLCLYLGLSEVEALSNRNDIMVYNVLVFVLQWKREVTPLEGLS